MNDAIVQNLHRLPRDIDLVVGIPRSGILAANLFCLVTNIPMTDLDSFIDRRVYGSGISTKRSSASDRDLSQMRRILILDDSIRSGKAMRAARDRLTAAGLGENVMLAAIYGTQPDHKEADFIFEVTPDPRIFQWNLMHHIVLEKSCMEVDGVLCVDALLPKTRKLADQSSMAEPVPLHRPTRRIGALVTYRPEAFRSATEDWLARHGIEYDALIMSDPSSRQDRQRPDLNGSFKGEIYRRSEARLFIDSDPEQAAVIARLSGKPAFCITTQEMFSVDSLSAAALLQRARNMPARMRALESTRLKAGVRSVLGEGGYNRLKALIRPKNSS